MIRVLVAEDSVTSRELMVALLRADPDIQVVGEAKNGVEALELAKSLRPSVITMDIHMPRLNGFEATKAIMREIPTPVVIVSGSVDPTEVATSMHALQAGALALLPKPRGPDHPGFEAEGRELVRTIKAMAGVKVIRHWAPRIEHEPHAPPAPADRPRIVALAASTGGPAALQQILSRLPPRFSLPIVVVQHIAAGFGAGFAHWLDTVSSLRVRMVQEPERLEPSTVYLAPEDRHLGVEAGLAVVSEAPAIGGFRPSASYLFHSVARVYGPSALAVVLTGMGEDGVDGLRAVKAARGRVVAQDEESSVVFGMPGVAVAAGLADRVVPLGKIADHIQELLQ
jgi:two-component system chemotaxis response regulator CheB